MEPVASARSLQGLRLPARSAAASQTAKTAKKCVQQFDGADPSDAMRWGATAASERWIRPSLAPMGELFHHQVPMPAITSRKPIHEVHPVPVRTFGLLVRGYSRSLVEPQPLPMGPGGSRPDGGTPGPGASRRFQAVRSIPKRQRSRHGETQRSSQACTGTGCVRAVDGIGFLRRR
jgi:hypothetical protein